jgi:hypothetical protein
MVRIMVYTGASVSSWQNHAIQGLQCQGAESWDAGTSLKGGRIIGYWDRSDRWVESWVRDLNNRWVESLDTGTSVGGQKYWMLRLSEG